MKKQKTSWRFYGQALGKFFTALSMLWCAHCIGDYSLQTKSIALYKVKSLLICIIHASVWTGIMLFGFFAIARMGLFWNTTQGIQDDEFPWPLLLSVTLILLISHTIIDYGKFYTYFFATHKDVLGSFCEQSQVLLIVDQLLHTLSFIVCYVVIGCTLKKVKTPN